MGKSTSSGWNGGQQPQQPSYGGKGRTSQPVSQSSNPVSYAPRMMDTGTQNNGVYTGGGYGLPPQPATGGGSSMNYDPSTGQQGWGDTTMVGPKMMDTGGSMLPPGAQTYGMTNTAPSTWPGTQWQDGGGYGRGGGMGAMVRALLGIPGLGGFIPRQPPQTDGGPVLPNPGNPPPTGGPTGPGSPPTPGGPPAGPPTTPTNPAAPQQRQTTVEWAQKFAQEHPEMQGQRVNIMDYVKPGADGSWSGPIMDAWKGNGGYDPNGYFGFKNGGFMAGNTGVIGQTQGWDDPNSASYVDARKNLDSQGFGVYVPQQGPNAVNGENRPPKPTGPGNWNWMPGQGWIDLGR